MESAPVTGPQFHRIGVVANLQKSEVRPFLAEFVQALVREKFEVFVEPRMQPYLASHRGVEMGIGRHCDVIVSLGGDGTILFTARQYADFEIPILGINVGRLGFLAEPLKADTVKRIKEGRFRIQDRMRIAVVVKEGDEAAQVFSALNDVVVHGAGFSRMVRANSGTNWRRRKIRNSGTCLSKSLARSSRMTRSVSIERRIPGR